jgi:hypothetical protein
MIVKFRLLETDETPLVARPLVGTNGQVMVTLILKNRPMVGAMLATTLHQTCLGGNPASSSQDWRRRWTASSYCTTFNALVVCKLSSNIALPNCGLNVHKNAVNRFGDGRLKISEPVRI